MKYLGRCSSSNSITLVSMNLISMAGKSRTVLTNFIVVTCLNIVLNLLLVPKYGLTGAALAVSLSYAVLGIMFFIQTKRHLNITPFKADMIKIAAISLIPALLLIGLSNLLQVKTLLVLLTSVILFGIVYAILIFASRSLDTHDKEVLDSLWKRVSAGLIWIKTISTPSRSD
jgi:O-antigen/teichoic acid export membrane protein